MILQGVQPTVQPLGVGYANRLKKVCMGLLPFPKSRCKELPHAV